MKKCICLAKKIFSQAENLHFFILLEQACIESCHWYCIFKFNYTEYHRITIPLETPFLDAYTNLESGESTTLTADLIPGLDAIFQTIPGDQEVEIVELR